MDFFGVVDVLVVGIEIDEVFVLLVLMDVWLVVVDVVEVGG